MLDLGQALEDILRTQYVAEEVLCSAWRRSVSSVEVGLVVDQAQEEGHLNQRFVVHPTLSDRRDLVDRDRWGEEEGQDEGHADDVLFVRGLHACSARARVA